MVIQKPLKATSEVLLAAKAALKAVVHWVVEVVQRAPVVKSTANVGVDGKEHSYAALAAPQSPALEVYIADDENEDASMQVNLSSVVSKVFQPKKAKLSAELNVADDPMSSSPDLPHKLPARMRIRPDQDSDDEDLDDSRDKNN